MVADDLTRRWTVEVNVGEMNSIPPHESNGSEADAESRSRTEITTVEIVNGGIL